MKIFVIGGTSYPESSAESSADVLELDRLMIVFSGVLQQSGHDLVICSPYLGSADRSLLNTLIGGRSGERKTNIELHIPSIPHIEAEVAKVFGNSISSQVQCFRHPAPVDDLPQSLSNAWLFAQLYALERSHAVLAIGGKLGGTTNLLLHLAEAKRKPLLAVPLLAGASEKCYWRRKYEIEDRLGDAAAKLTDKNTAPEWISMIERLADPSSRTAPDVGHSSPAFFISYSRSRPQEADMVEMILRRRNLSVYRDERDFEPGNLIETEIENHIRRASVFIALYSKDYACSPWCYDELRVAASLHHKHEIKLWLLTLDDTRIVLPEARSIVTIPANNRGELEGKLNQQLDRLIEL